MHCPDAFYKCFHKPSYDCAGSECVQINYLYKYIKFKIIIALKLYQFSKNNFINTCTVVTLLPSFNVVGNDSLTLPVDISEYYRIKTRTKMLKLQAISL